MALRSIRERAYQTIAYEAGGFLIAMPLYGLIAGHDASQSSLLIVAVALACMAWSPLHNTLFDWIEWKLARRLASDRPQRFRMLHAISHEVTSIVITNPIIMLVGGYSFWHALVIDIGLTLLYSVYAYFFHIAYDRLRPVEAQVVAQWDDFDAGHQPEPVLALFEAAEAETEPLHEPVYEPPPAKVKRASMRLRARRPARWAPQVMPHAALALIPARRDDSRFNGF